MDGITVNYHASIKISKDDNVIYFEDDVELLQGKTKTIDRHKTRNFDNLL